LADSRLGLLIDFNAALIKDGITASPIDWKKNLTPSRKDAKNTSEASLRSKTSPGVARINAGLRANGWPGDDRPPMTG
jgi:hypothetical protein